MATEKKYASLQNLQDFKNKLDETFATQADMEEALAGKSDSTHDHDADYDASGAASSALTEAKGYTDTKVSGLASTSSVNSGISTHNTSTSAHNDIRALITDLTTKLNNFLDVDDTTTDQLSEVLTLINNNKGTLESLTSGKVNVSDIVNDLTTNSSSKVLSAAQGVALKNLIDTLQGVVDGKSDEGHGHAISDVTNLQNNLDAKVPTSRTVNGKSLSENISLSASDVGAYTKSEIDNYSFITVDDIDAICDGSITVATASEVAF